MTPRYFSAVGDAPASSAGNPTPRAKTARPRHSEDVDKPEVPVGDAALGATGYTRPGKL